MSRLRPKKGSDVVQIPVTLDRNNKARITTEGKKMWLVLFLLLWVFTSILVIVGKGGTATILYPIASFLFLLYIFRFIIMKEKYFKAKREELIENNYRFDFTTFWGIYDISEHYPYIVQFADGRKGIFVSFDKDVIVGKQDYDDFYHHEAIGDAYQQMIKRNIECMHIDYMDTVGKDDRLTGLFESANNAENPDLRRVLTRIYDNIEYNMNKSYACYDVYCFYFRGREDIFWDELQVVLQKFLEANYVRHRVLNKEELTELVESIINVNDFSVNKATEGLFKEMNATDYLNVIWTELDGKRTIHNKTREEKAEAKRVSQAESKLLKIKRKKDKLDKKNKKKQNKRGLFKKQSEPVINYIEDEDIEL